MIYRRGMCAVSEERIIRVSDGDALYWDMPKTQVVWDAVSILFYCPIRFNIHIIIHSLHRSRTSSHNVVHELSCSLTFHERNIMFTQTLTIKYENCITEKNI